MTKLKTSLLSRSMGLARMAAATQVSQLKERLLNLEGAKLINEKILLVTKLSEEMSELRGGMLKVGQLLSLDAGDFLPPEAVEVLQKLQKDVEPIPFKIIENQLKVELREKFSQLTVNSQALAVASIGQVHEATWRDEVIILKVQYPRIRESIPNDIKMIRFMMGQWALIFQKAIDFVPFLEELKTTLLQETDYRQEAGFLTRAHDLFAKDERFLVPKIIPELCTEQVLAMERMHGKSLPEWLKSTPSKTEKEQIARSLFELFMLEFFTFGFVQTDPNPGNFLITPDLKIVLLDFGATKTFEPQFIKEYSAILQAAYEKNDERMLQLSFDFNLLSPKESEATLDLYLKMMDATIEPFRSDRPFSFNDKQYAEDSKNNAMRFMKACKFSPPPKNIIFLHRKLGGVFQMIKQMDVALNLHQYWINDLSIKFQKP
jgi:aarF domain-containing kinase